MFFVGEFAMPSFDIVSEFDQHEVSNAVDQANREVGTRFDFKGSDAKFELKENKITLKTETDFQLKQMLDVLRNKFAKRNVDAAHMKIEDPVIQHKSAEQVVTLLQGIETDTAKKIVKLIKSEKNLKVQTAIQGEQLRVTGKKRDDLQAVIAVLREKDMGVPLQFNNFRD